MSAAEALAMLCHERSLSLEVIRGPSRKREHARLRWRLAYELVAADFNQSEIARAMNKHPSSLSSGLRGGKSRFRKFSPQPPSVMCSCCRRRP